MVPAMIQPRGGEGPQQDGPSDKEGQMRKASGSRLSGFGNGSYVTLRAGVDVDTRLTKIRVQDRRQPFGREIVRSLWTSGSGAGVLSTNTPCPRVTPSPCPARCLDLHPRCSRRRQLLRGRMARPGKRRVVLRLDPPLARQSSRSFELASLTA